MRGLWALPALFGVGTRENMRDVFGLERGSSRRDFEISINFKKKIKPGKC